MIHFFKLERLQRENADEWGKRERLETEKLALERENKKCRAQIRDLEDQVENKKQQTSAVVDSDMRSLHQDLNDKTKVRNVYRTEEKELTVWSTGRRNFLVATSLK